jgi:hypothetical protein
LADEYQIRVKMEAGPFEVDDKSPSVVRAGDLRS